MRPYLDDACSAVRALDRRNANDISARWQGDVKPELPCLHAGNDLAVDGASHLDRPPATDISAGGRRDAAHRREHGAADARIEPPVRL